MLSLGQESTVEALGRTWRLSRLELRVIREFRDWIKQREGDPFARCDGKWFDKLPAEEQVRRVKEAESVAEQLRCFTLQCELAKKWTATEEGIGKLGQLMLREYQPGVTEEQAFAIFQEVGGQMQKAMAEAAGEMPLGNAAAA